MAIMKIIVLVSLLVVVLASSQAQAQLPSGSGSLLNITGTIMCSLDGAAIVPDEATPTPAFPIQLTCEGKVVSSAITNADGTFNIVLNLQHSLLARVLSSGQVVVATPLASCNASLPADGFLHAPLQLAGTTVSGSLNVVNLVPAVF
ncbi:hypothetical protein CTI12_AA050490 [Artemisia annua]|uniref:Phylloplanin-like n=1 Tax=Artemisia annua TaxID=35608 RepID=A0A2U1QBG3_ARTAN|nr:hypothetical protein CTI12_AA050490 [Artemisia annua]